MVLIAENQDKTAFTELYEYFAPRVKSFLMRGGLSNEQADELAQETMLNVWHKAKNFDPKRAQASTWIFTIARNKKIDWLRKSSTQEMTATDVETVERHDETQTPVETLGRNQESEIIKKALKDLPYNQSELVHKAFFEGKTHQKIAEEIKVPLGTVKSRIRLALQKLKGKKSIEGLR